MRLTNMSCTCITFNKVESATPERVRFRSNLLAGFGAGFVTPVNTINFATVFDDFGQKLIDNVAVWTTILAFIIIYIPFAVMARHFDKKDAFKVNVLTVIDATRSSAVAERPRDASCHSIFC